MRDQRIDELYRFQMVAAEQQQMAEIDIPDARSNAIAQVVRWADLSMHPDYHRVWVAIESRAPYISNLLRIPNSYFFRSRHFLQYLGLVNEVEERIGPGARDFAVDPVGPLDAALRRVRWERLSCSHFGDNDGAAVLAGTAMLLRRVYRVLEHPKVVSLRFGQAPDERWGSGLWWVGPRFHSIEELWTWESMREEAAEWVDDAWQILGEAEPALTVDGRLL